MYLTVSTSSEKRGTLDRTKKFPNHFNIDDVGMARNRVRAPVVSTTKKSLRSTYGDMTSSMIVNKNNNNDDNYNNNNNNNVLNKPFITGKFKNQTDRILNSGNGKYL